MNSKSNTPLRPKTSFNLMLNELIRNRQRLPCDIVRELLLNATQAKASQVLILPYFQGQGLVFFDNGPGLSASREDAVRGVTPYQAFFSLGFSTKPCFSGTHAAGTGGKLCFGGSRLSVLTRCRGEVGWRMKLIDEPLKTLVDSYSLQPERISDPADRLRRIIPRPNWWSEAIIQTLSRDFFGSRFQTGTLLIIEGIVDPNYAANYYVQSADSFLPKYVRSLIESWQRPALNAASCGSTNFKWNPPTIEILTYPTFDFWLVQDIGQLCFSRDA